jgi:hypothetical protein
VAYEQGIFLSIFTMYSTLQAWYRVIECLLLPVQFFLIFPTPTTSMPITVPKEIILLSNSTQEFILQSGAAILSYLEVELLTVAAPNDFIFALPASND